MIGQVVRVLIQLIGTVVLARLLTPDEFGLVAMVVAFTGLAELLRDLGLSTAVVRAPSVSVGQRDNLFWLNTLFGVLVAAFAVLCSHSVGRFYGDSRVSGVVIALSVCFILNGLSTQYRADLNRRLRFRHLTIVEVAATFSGVSAGVVVAALGGSYWSLVANSIVQALCGLVMAVWFSKWLPGRPRRGTGIRPFLSFGWRFVAAQVVGYAGNNADTAVIGSQFGSAAAGLYGRAYQLLMVPLGQFQAPASRVAIPILARALPEPASYRRLIVRGQAVLLHVIVPLFAVAFPVSSDIVGVLLGDRWLEVGTLFRILCVAGVCQAANYATYWVFVSKGLAAAQLRYTVVTRIGMVGAIAVGSNWGLAGVAAAYSASIGSMWIAGLIVLTRVSNAPTLSMFANGARTILGYATASALTVVSLTLAPDVGGIASIATGVFLFAAWVFLVVCLWTAFRKDLFVAIGVVSKALRR